LSYHSIYFEVGRVEGGAKRAAGGKGVGVPADFSVLGEDRDKLWGSIRPRLLERAYDIWC